MELMVQNEKRLCAKIRKTIFKTRKMKAKTILLMLNITIVLFVTSTITAQNVVADSLFAINSRLTVPLIGASNGFGGGTTGNFLMQPDGKIIYGGTIYGPDNDFFIAMMRFDECGILDTSFGDEGTVRHKFNQRNLGKTFALQADGKIVVVGIEGPSNAGSQQRANICRFNSDGTPDTTFNLTGSRTVFNASGSFNSVHIMTDGRLLCFGSFGSGLGSGIARFMPDGSFDSTFGTDGLVFFNGPFQYFGDVQGHVLSDGKMIVTSYTSDSTSEYHFLAARFLGTGELDTSYGTNGYYYDAVIPVSGYFHPFTSVIDSNGKLLLSKSRDNTSFDILRLTAAGTLDNTFGTGGHVHYDSGGTTTGIQLFEDGKILVRGTAISTGNFAPSCGIRFLTNGTPDPTFGPNGLRLIDILHKQGSEQLNALLVLPNGQWIAAAINGYYYFKKYGDLYNFPHISKSGSVLSTTGTGSYQWFLDGIAIPTATNQTYIPSQNGNYTVMITDANGCTGVSSAFNITNLGLASNSLDNKIIIYPNPSTGKVNISAENETIDKVEIINILGEVVSLKTQDASQIDISELANGLYVFKIHSGAAVIQKKVIKH